MIKVLALDLGGVLASNPPRHVIREIALHYELDVEQVIKAWNRYWTGFIIGEMTEDGFYESLIRELHIEGHRKITIDEIKEMSRNFISVLPHHMDFFKRIKFMLGQDVPALMRKHKRGAIKFALVSNNSKEWWEYLGQNHDFSMFDHQILSFEQQTAKPSEDMFLEVTKQFEVKPEEVLFVDDKASNCDAAERFGMRSIRFTNLREFIDKLNEEKIINARESNELLRFIESHEEKEAEEGDKEKEGEESQ